MLRLPHRTSRWQHLILSGLGLSGSFVVTTSLPPQPVTAPQELASVEMLPVAESPTELATNSSKKDRKVHEVSLKPTAITHAAHHNIVASIFWVGEPPSGDNSGISNTETEWDPEPQAHFGGYDDPTKRTASGLPAGFTPLHNPYYCALPVAEHDDAGNLITAARSRSPWADETIAAGHSLLKGRWIKLQKGSKTAYCQWLDSGPYQTRDYNYVYGTSPPKNKVDLGAGIDVSPSVAAYLNFLDDGDGSATVSWQFVDSATAGPWQNFTAINAVNYWEE